jgi:hypothetical protein
MSTKRRIVVFSISILAVAVLFLVVYFVWQNNELEERKSIMREQLTTVNNFAMFNDKGHFYMGIEALAEDPGPIKEIVFVENKNDAVSQPDTLLVFPGEYSQIRLDKFNDLIIMEMAGGGLDLKAFNEKFDSNLVMPLEMTDIMENAALINRLVGVDGLNMDMAAKSAVFDNREFKYTSDKETESTP